MKFFHVTGARNADSIDRDGFRDSLGRFEPGTQDRWGVWIANRPLGRLETCCDRLEVCFEFELDEELIAEFEYVRDGPFLPYREWLVPAALLNAQKRTRHLIDPPDLPPEWPGEPVVVHFDIDFCDD